MLQDSLHEMAKPLARYRDDEDLDSMLKDQLRDGDPMAMFMKKKKNKNPDNSINGILYILSVSCLKYINPETHTLSHTLSVSLSLSLSLYLYVLSIYLLLFRANL